MVSVAGAVVGALPPFEVDSPWWADIEPVAPKLDALLGVPAAVLRIVSVVGGQSPRGGEVTYLVEAATLPDVPLEPVPDTGLLRPEPFRAAWAEPGGPRAILDWADAALATCGRPRTRPPVQIKTWNLSCVYRIPTADGPVWSKTIGGFLSPEAAAIALVAEHDPTLVPTVLAADPQLGRTLLDHVPGIDRWDADEDLIRTTITRWVAVQAALAGDRRAQPDRRLSTLSARVRPVLARADVRAQLTTAEMDEVEALLAALPELVAVIDTAGLPDTLVHGDFHPGNWRSVDGGPARVVDWGDSSYGHPAPDLLTLRGYLPPERWPVAVEAWVTAWRAAVPGSDPAAALPFLDPLGRLEGAYTYQRFLDHIEPDEWPYHRDDPADELRAAGAAFRALPAAALRG